VCSVVRRKVHSGMADGPVPPGSHASHSSLSAGRAPSAFREGAPRAWRIDEALKLVEARDGVWEHDPSQPDMQCPEALEGLEQSLQSARERSRRGAMGSLMPCQQSQMVKTLGQCRCYGSKGKVGDKSPLQEDSCEARELDDASDYHIAALLWKLQSRKASWTCFADGQPARADDARERTYWGWRLLSGSWQRVPAPSPQSGDSGSALVTRKLWPSRSISRVPLHSASCVLKALLRATGRESPGDVTRRRMQEARFLEAQGCGG